MSTNQINNMNDWTPLMMWYAILTLIVILFASVLMPTANATVISFQEQYQDYTGAFHPYTSYNLAKYPLYIIIDNGNTYTVSRIDDSIEFIKQNTTYSFENNKISFTLNLTPQQLNSRSTQDGANWYINIPKPLTSKRFTWDFKKPIVTNNTGYVIPNNNFWFTNSNGQPRLYYNQTARSVGAQSTYINFSFNSFIISNVTSSGWTDANITLNGIRITDEGNLSIHLKNDSALNMSGLVAYWSADETTGITWHNVNNESGLFNSTNQGTWNGDPILGYTSGVIGNAGLFDGIDDYVDAGNDVSLDLISNITVSAWIELPTLTQQVTAGIIDKQTAIPPRNGYDLYFDDATNTVNFEIWNAAVAAGAYGSVPLVANRKYLVVGTYDKTDLKLYVNGSQEVSVPDSMGIGTNAHTLTIGIFAGKFINGMIDEVHIWNRSLSASEISILYNTSLRTKGNVTIWKQNATSGYIINRARLNVSNIQQNNNTVNLYTKPNSSATWNLTAINLSNNTWYNIDSGNQSTSQDFLVELSGNGSDTPFFTSLEWDETLISPPTILQTNWCNQNNVSFNETFVIGTILLFVLGAVLLYVGLTDINIKFMISGIGVIIGGVIVLVIGNMITSRLITC